MSKIIGICGLAGSGKNTVADYICEKNKDWQQMAFADTLKNVTAELFGWSKDMIYGNTPEARKKREEVDKFWASELGIKDFTPRMALQKIGTDLFRNNFNEDFWIICLKKKIKNSLCHVVVTDVRFPNELKMIKDMGGQIVQVTRGEFPDWYQEAEEMNKRILEQPFLDKRLFIERSTKLENIHPSEYSLAGLINPDYLIKNDGTLEDLHTQIDEMMKSLYE